MKKILGIVSSARRLGNCEIMVKEVFRNLAGPCELNLLRLTDFRIDPCRGCYHCLFKDGDCVIDDDCSTVLAAISSADALILAAPAYFLGAHSALKRFLDRGLSFYGEMDRMWGKPAVGVAVAGIPGMEGSTLLGIESFLKLILADIRQTQVVYGALPGEIFLDDGNRKVAQTLAHSLFGPKVSKSAPCCSLCGGDTFRFMGPHRVRCMLCSNAGTLHMENGAAVIEMEMADHQLFLTRQDVRNHKTWLIGMKERFMGMRKTLKPISVNYLKDGEWINPHSKTHGAIFEKDDEE
ncbi:flavodoxin family protein [uncultured Desulfosarcina sp.]|uniref:flavodoxin family protein n=1 Tax=uncultured Desulfosarcina sp. TaxID=218289 RepID=UPI0029C83F9A|nr:flavodoxin family protein [uncultured Desulfosarcina sp.]